MDESQPPLKGQQEIASATLEPVPSPPGVPGTWVTITMPEFTCLCPRTGYPDFAQVLITYQPGDFIIELKSFKLWLNSFRDAHHYHEELCALVFETLSNLLKPQWLEVCLDYSRRGNVKTRVFRRSGPPPETYADLRAEALRDL